jgi:hypothetical protein
MHEDSAGKKVGEIDGSCLDDEVRYKHLLFGNEKMITFVDFPSP